MPKITDYGDYDVFKTPGLYTIINERSATVLDLYQSKAAAGTAIIGLYVFVNGTDRHSLIEQQQKRLR